MIKLLFSFFISTASFAQAWHGRDSVGVFYTSSKVSVLVGEIFNPKRLHLLYDAAGLDGERMELASADGSFRIQCFRIPEAADCKFFFSPSDSVAIKPRQVEARIPLNLLDRPLTGDFRIDFKSANGDKFTVVVSPQDIYLLASKR